VQQAARDQRQADRRGERQPDRDQGPDHVVLGRHQQLDQVEDGDRGQPEGLQADQRGAQPQGGPRARHGSGPYLRR
jgi:hypothetical protein